MTDSARFAASWASPLRNSERRSASQAKLFPTSKDVPTRRVRLLKSLVGSNRSTESRPGGYLDMKMPPTLRGRGLAGAHGRTRTPNLLIRSQMLYPLSHVRLGRIELYPLPSTGQNQPQQPNLYGAARHTQAPGGDGGGGGI